MKIKVLENFRKQLEAFTKKYSSVSDKAVERLECFFESDDQRHYPGFKNLNTKGNRKAVDAYSLRILGVNAPGGPRVIMAKSSKSSYVPIFIGNHKEYEHYLIGRRVDLEIEAVRSGCDIETLETDDYKKATKSTKLNSICHGDVLEFSHFSTPYEGRYITCQKAGITFSEAQLAVFESVSFDMDLSSVKDASVTEALEELKTAKELIMQCSPREIKSGVEAFQMVYFEMDKQTRSQVFDYLGVQQEWSNVSENGYLSNGEYSDSQATAEESYKNAGQTILMMADFQQNANAGIFADHVQLALVAQAEGDSEYEEVPEFT